MSTAGRPKAKKQRRITFDERTPAGTAEMLEHFSVAGQFNWKLLFWVDVVKVNRKHAFVADEIRELRAAARRLRTAIAEKNWIAAERADAAANTTYLRMRLVYASPLASAGRKFLENARKPGSFGWFRQGIAQFLKRRHHLVLLKPRAVWDELAEKPPKSWTFKDNRQGRYIEGPNGVKNVNYSHFSNVLKEEQDKLKALKLRE